MTSPKRPGNDLPDRRPFLDKFKKWFPVVVFTISGSAVVGLMVGLIITAVGK